MQTNDVFVFESTEYVAKNIDGEMVRATKLVDGRPQRGRPRNFKLADIQGLVDTAKTESLKATNVNRTKKAAASLSSSTTNTTEPAKENTAVEASNKEKLEELLNSLPSDEETSDSEDSDEEVELSSEEKEELASVFNENQQ